MRSATAAGAVLTVGSAFSTVTAQVAVLSSAVSSVPFDAVAVMVAVPSATAVTTPFSSTVATVVSLDDQVTVLSVAPSGATVAVRVSVPPYGMLAVVLLRSTPVTSTFDG